MKNSRISECALILFLCVSFSAFTFEPVSTQNLLTSYLENDNDLKNVVLDLQKSQLSQESVQINNGFDITLSTGTFTVSTGSDGTSYSLKPSVTASLPQARNLSVTASSDISKKDGESSVEDSRINASIDIISTNSLARRISLLKAQRSVTEAKRKVQNQAVNSEKAFYTELKSLLNSTSSIISAQKTLYTDKIDFEKIKVQGYSESSSTYRIAQLKVLTEEHEIESDIRSLIHAYVRFYKKCGVDAVLDESADFYALVPSDIAETSPLDIHSFTEEQYCEVESAVWNNYINSLQRKTDSFFSLGANGGITFNNSANDATTIDAGLSSTIGGLKLGAGISMPLDSSKNNAFTFSASLNPNIFRLNSITSKTGQLEEQQEYLAIDTARDNYANKVLEMEQSLSDLEWTRKSNQESYEMYLTLEKDLAQYLAGGYVTESEYYSAKVNLQSCAVKKVINSIDYIMYNESLMTMFVSDKMENK